MRHSLFRTLVLASLFLTGAALQAQPAQTPSEKKPMHPIATIETNKGTIRIELYPEEAPKTVENFIKLTKKGYYDGLVFHRVIPDFVIQTGDPNGDGSGGPGYTIPDERSSKIKHEVGAVAMAKTAAPNSAGSQFYIVIGKPAPHLDGGYTAFGKVISGQPVAESIRVGDKMLKVTVTGADDAPTTNANVGDRSAMLVRMNTPKLPDVTLKATDKGTVKVKFIISADGKTQVELVEGSGNSDVDKALLSSLEQWKWLPALKGGSPISTSQEIAIELPLRQER
jgi:peptidyl-prolyl cis-trans isomerase B (cyclophilin B)